MSGSDRPERDAASSAERLLGEIRAGLTGPGRSLPPKLFYDEAGCALFGAITALPEYYPTRTELALLEAHAGAIASHARAGSTLVEYGASDEAKASFLLRTGRFAIYVPIDIAPGALDAIADRLARTMPGLRTIPVCADFSGPVSLPDAADRPAFGFFPGSTLGNMTPDDAVGFLSRVRGALGGAGARLALGTDLRKDPARLIAAYDDAAGVTARFNRNILLHVNRLADGNFDPERFDHRATWNEREGRIEMHLVSTSRQHVRVAGLSLGFEPGDTIHTENSYKYSVDGVAALVARAGWSAAATWQDPDRLFAVHLLEATR